MNREAVTARVEKVVFPTYPAPPPDLNPMFLDKRNNQGSSGRIYPNPLTDRVSGEKVDRAYEAVILENEYIQLMMLPELGGRIQIGFDKTNGYDFFYRQHVIKPALIGLCGSWISGGAEFNWPQHHRPSTFMPVEFQIEEHADGSRTVWLSEHEPMERTKGMVGICLHPGRALVEMKVRLYNRTPFLQRFLWWVNTAVHVHEEYQVFFPPDVTYVTHHTKAFMTSYPVACGRYNDIDFGAGADISWYRNAPSPTSYFVNESRGNFFGGYDHKRRAGVVHVANHHIAPGQKLFTWGNNPFGLAWNRNLTDEDGHYAELMAGAYTDNQPDFSWLQPYETKTFSQYWYPIQAIGTPVQANERAAVQLETRDGQARLGVYANEVLKQATITLSAGNKPLLRQCADLGPGVPWTAAIPLDGAVPGASLTLRVDAADGSEVVTCESVPRVEKPVPDPWPQPAPPVQLKTVEELFLAGLHLEQYAFSLNTPEPYWEEALRRDPADARTNTALGRLWLHRGDLPKAETLLRQAVKTLTRWNRNPADGEPHYQLGMALLFQRRLDDAYDALYKAIWSYAWQAAGYYALATIDTRRNDFAAALAHLDRALSVNTENLKARNLKSAVLRRQNRLDEAGRLVDETIAKDALDFWARNEKVLIDRARGDAANAQARVQELVRLMHGAVQTHLDIAFDYASAGFYDEASDLLMRLVEGQGGKACTYPMVFYVMGWLARLQGRDVDARQWCGKAAGMPADYCFPARLEEQEVLQGALALNPADGRAHYYLGNLLYDKYRHAEAIQHWEAATRLEPGFAIPWRNLGLACFNDLHDPARARACYEKAFAANPRDPRLLYELDQLLKRMGVPPVERLARLEQHRDLVVQRENLTVELVMLYNLTGQPQKMLTVLLAHRFHPWEGGEGAVTSQYSSAHLQLGRAALEAGCAGEALARFQTAQEFPESLGEARSSAAPDPLVAFHLGLAKDALDRADEARTHFQQAAKEPSALSAATYIQALALRKLGKEAEAVGKLKALAEFAAKQAETAGKDDFIPPPVNYLLFADDVRKRMFADAAYLSGLACLGLGRSDEARRNFQSALGFDISHPGATEELRRLA